jgi:hypothetical protein
MVLCVDEKSQIQALDRTTPLLPMRPEQIERRTHDYVRHGTASLFAALDIKAGEVLGACHRRDRFRELLSFLSKVDAAVPADLEVHLVMDRGSGCGDPLRDPQGAGLQDVASPEAALPPALHADQRLVAEPGRAVVRNPHRRAVAQGVSSAAPGHSRWSIESYIDHTNSQPRPFIWTRAAGQVLETVARSCRRISDSGH